LKIESTRAPSGKQNGTCEQGFVALLEDFDELVLDVPEAVQLMALFVSRAVVDEVLPPSFVTRITPPPGSHLEKMKVLCAGHLHDTHSSERLLRCWGSGTLLSWEMGGGH
jgi:programmed cell death protein 4